MSYLPFKKRRLDGVQSALSKPFKSPLRRPVCSNGSDSSKENVHIDKKGQNELDEREAANYVMTPTKVAVKTYATQATPQQSLSPASPYAATSPPVTPTSTTNRGYRSNNPPVASTFEISMQAQQQVNALQKQLSALHAQLSALRITLDTTTQAVKIEQSKQDIELEALILKWRHVTREAAEELFASAKERVDRMGGVGAWKDKIKQSKLRRAEWDAPVDTGGEEDEDEDGAGSDVEKEKAARRREIEEEIEASRNEDGEQKEEESEGEEDESFTMDMMLKNLNVDIKTVGFDKLNQRWVD